MCRRLFRSLVNAHVQVATAALGAVHAAASSAASSPRPAPRGPKRDFSDVDGDVHPPTSETPRFPRRVDGRSPVVLSPHAGGLVERQ